MERLLKCLGTIFITSSNYKLKLGNDSFMGAESDFVAPFFGVSLQVQSTFPLHNLKAKACCSLGPQLNEQPKMHLKICDHNSCLKGF